MSVSDHQDPFFQTLQYLENKKPLKVVNSCVNRLQHLQDQLMYKLKNFYNEVYAIAKREAHSDDLG
jgi:hypothetical protein